MSYIINIFPIQKKGVAFQSITVGNLLIENPDDTSGYLPMNVPISYDIGLNSYYFNVNTIFNAQQGYRFTMDITFVLLDGTICDRQYIFYDEILPRAAFTTGFSVGFKS